MSSEGNKMELKDFLTKDEIATYKKNIQRCSGPLLYIENRDIVDVSSPLQNICFKNCKVKGCVLTDCKAENSVFQNCRIMLSIGMKSSNFLSCDISSTTLVRCEITKTKLYDCNQGGCSFSDSAFLRLRNITYTTGVIPGESNKDYGWTYLSAEKNEPEFYKSFPYETFTQIHKRVSPYVYEENGKQNAL